MEEKSKGGSHKRNQTYVESEPRVGSSKEDLEVLGLAEIVPEVGPAGLGSVDELDELVCFNVRFGVFQDSLDIMGSPIDVALDIHGKPRGFWDCETEIESDASGHAAETDEQTPHVIDGGEAGY